MVHETHGAGLVVVEVNGERYSTTTRIGRLVLELLRCADRINAMESGEVGIHLRYDARGVHRPVLIERTLSELVPSLSASATG